MIKYSIMALMFVSGAMLAGQDGEWFPWINILGIALWCFLPWMWNRDNKSNKGDQMTLATEVFDPTKVIDSYNLMEILHSSNLMIFADDGFPDGLDTWKDHFTNKDVPWALCKKVTKSGYAVYQLWRIRKAGEE